MKRPLILASVVAILSFPAGYYLGIRSGAPLDIELAQAAHRGVPAPLTPAPSLRSPSKDSVASGSGNGLAGLTRDEVKARSVLALRHADRLQRWKAWLEIVAAADADSLPAVSEALIDRYSAGVDTGWEGGVLQHREGQILGALAMDKLPAEPNGEVAWNQRNKMRGWASVSPTEAKEWIEKLEPGTVQNTLRSEWLQGLAEAAPASIAAVFPSLDARQQPPLLDGIIRGIHEQGGLQGVRTWFDDTGKKLDPNVASEALARITDRLTSNTDPANADEAAAMLISQASEPYMTPAVFTAYSYKVAGHDPGKALTLLSDLAAKSPAIQTSMDSLIARTVETSTSGSLNKLGTWLNANPGHPVYDQAVYHFALRTNADDPEAARHWASTIRDASLRQATEQSLQSSR